MKRIICFFLGHKDEPLDVLMVKWMALDGEIIYSWKCERCKRVRGWYRNV